MKDEKSNFDVLMSIERHIEALKSLSPKQVMVCIGEYPIKTMLKELAANMEGILPILVEKSSEDIYHWIPKGFDPFFVWGFEDLKIDTHFWYDIQETVMKDNSIIDALKKKSSERLRSAIIFASIWDGIGSATLPTLISKFQKTSFDSLSIAIMPSKIQPPDAHFNAYAALQLCSATEGSTVLLLDRDQLESYEGVDRRGELIKGNKVVNYLLNMFLEKEALVSEISELSRTFGTNFFTGIVVTGASNKVYGSLENMLNAAWIKPLLGFDLPSSSLLYVLIRMPTSLKDELSRSKIELAIANWFKDKTDFQSIFITEPIYTDDMTDRIDAVLFVGGFDTSYLLSGLQRKVEPLKSKAVEKGFMTNDWQLIVPKIEEPKYEMPPESVESPPVEAENKTVNVQDLQPAPTETVFQETNIIADIEGQKEAKPEEPTMQIFEPQQAQAAPESPVEPDKTLEVVVSKKLKTTRKKTVKKKSASRRKKTEKVEGQK
ncbi:MAG: hypothetical protein ACM3JE_02110 [Betaproteobacteria bacterium]